MTCSGSHGTGTPQESFGRDSDTSWSPPRMNESASLRRKSGRTKSGRSANRRSSGSWNALRRKNQFCWLSQSSGISWMGQVLSGPRSASDLKSAQRGQYQPS